MSHGRVVDWERAQKTTPSPSNAISCGPIKRVQETTPPTSNASRNMRPTCDLDLDILECPICIEPLSTPVYQCQNGHQLCSACHMKIRRCPSCSEPVGNIRNLLAEKIMESLQVKCKHAPSGCEQMLQYSTREDHTKNLCAYRACPCPVPECTHQGPKQSLALHLEKEHNVTSVPIKLTSSFGLRQEAHFTMRFKADEYGFVLLKDVYQKVQLLLHIREAVHEPLGHFLFCTTFENHTIKYDLRVNSGLNGEAYSMIGNALAQDIRFREKWNRDAVFVPKTIGESVAMSIYYSRNLCKDIRVVTT